MSNKNVAISNLLNYYSKVGFRVFPTHYKTDAGCSCKKAGLCEKAGKHPAVTGYQHLASSQFKKLTTDKSLFGGKFQNHDIGALAGYEWFVVDSDRGELEGMPRTWKSKSANRGFHYFFKIPSGTQIKNIGELIPNVDIKGWGGFVVLPSECNNREWINHPYETDLADAPAWILEKIQNHEQNRKKVHSGVSVGVDLSSKIIEEGARNDTLFRYACYLRSLSMEDEILPQLTVINEKRCNPPVGVDELRDIVSSACKYSLDDDLTDILTLFREALMSSIHWKGKADKSNRSILVALLHENEERYEVVPKGLEVSISYRKLAEKTGINKKSIYTRINQAPYLRKGKPPKGNQSGTIVILYSLLECVPTTTLTSINGGGEMVSVVATTHTLLFNSIRWGNLGKSAALILETLMDKPYKRKDLEERLGYSKGGVSGVLKKLKDKELVQAHNRVYSLADDFDKKIRPFLDQNSKDIEKMKKVHERDREGYGLRLEAWKRARADESEIRETAAEDQGTIYFFKVMFDEEAKYQRVQLNMLHHYQQLISGRDDQEDKALGEEVACAS